KPLPVEVSVSPVVLTTNEAEFKQKVQAMVNQIKNTVGAVSPISVRVSGSNSTISVNTNALQTILTDIPTNIGSYIQTAIDNGVNSLSSIVSRITGLPNPTANITVNNTTHASVILSLEGIIRQYPDALQLEQVMRRLTPQIIADYCRTTTAQNSGNRNR
ncbi:MAG: hypothetical protein ACRC1W_03730, partial [Shewanella sp.]